MTRPTRYLSSLLAAAVMGFAAGCGSDVQPTPSITLNPAYEVLQPEPTRRPKPTPLPLKERVQQRARKELGTEDVTYQSLEAVLYGEDSYRNLIKFAHSKDPETACYFDASNGSYLGKHSKDPARAPHLYVFQDPVLTGVSRLVFAKKRKRIPGR
ncbi:hypothetical protein HZB02_01790 [Candidatus Woesearchaeota archaeon]|nr:hypothetical protein [Candidatus Woesearchaeota archaeon]